MNTKKACVYNRPDKTREEIDEIIGQPLYPKYLLIMNLVFLGSLINLLWVSTIPEPNLFTVCISSISVGSTATYLFRLLGDKNDWKHGTHWLQYMRVAAQDVKEMQNVIIRQNNIITETRKLLKSCEGVVKRGCDNCRKE